MVVLERIIWYHTNTILFELDKNTWNHVTIEIRWKHLESYTLSRFSMFGGNTWYHITVQKIILET